MGSKERVSSRVRVLISSNSSLLGSGIGLGFDHERLELDWLFFVGSGLWNHASSTSTLNFDLLACASAKSANSPSPPNSATDLAVQEDRSHVSFACFHFLYRVETEQFWIYQRTRRWCLTWSCWISREERRSFEGLDWMLEDWSKHSGGFLEALRRGDETRCRDVPRD